MARSSWSSPWRRLFLLCLLVGTTGTAGPLACTRSGFASWGSGSADGWRSEAGAFDAAGDVAGDVAGDGTDQGSTQDAIAETGPPDGAVNPLDGAVNPLDGAVNPPDGAVNPLENLWSKTMGDISDDQGTWVVVDASGNITLMATFAGTIDPGGGEITSYSTYHDLFVTSFTSEGVHRWQLVLNGITNPPIGQGMVVDGSGNVTIAGSFTGSVVLGSGGVASRGRDIFVTSFSRDGVHRWKKIIGGVDDDSAYALAVDNSGNVTVTGRFEDHVNFGGGDVYAWNYGDIFIVSFSTDGDYRWHQALGGDYYDRGTAVAADSSGNVTIAGTFEVTAELGGAPLTSVGDKDVFVTSFSSDGVHRWQKALGGALDDSARSIAVDGSGNITLVGTFQEMAELGGGGVTSKGLADIFITSFSANGVHRWQKALGGTLDDMGASIATDGNGNLTLVGGFEGTLDLGGGNETSKGLADIFISNFSPNG
ncbi:MAG: hypothetical protein JRH20_17555, partial [Deltaproteobacteria bacterium]|nr:hypothetical protein [Deltaproteobacteria bacterium]